MKTFTTLFMVIALVAIGYAAYIFIAKPDPVTPTTNATTTPTNVVTSQQYSNAKYGISFTYPDSYALTEHLNEGSGMRESYTIVLTPKKDLPAPEGGEYPPSITFDIYQNNLDNQTTEGWIRNSERSNFKLSPEGRLSTTTIDGKEALSYRWDGLYQGSTIALAQPSWVYAFTVTYLDTGADIIQDFAAIRDTIRITN